MAGQERAEQRFDVTCPSCGARLRIDAELGKVVHHDPPPKHAKAPDLDKAARLLQKEAARREALFRQSVKEEKTKPDLLQAKFEEALKKTKDEPVGPSLRDIDLD